MKNKLVIILSFPLVLLIIINLLLNKQKYLNTIWTQRNIIEDIRYEKDDSDKRLLMLVTNDNFHINPSGIITDENGGQFGLNSINFSNFIFVVRFSEFSCNECISHEYNLLSEYPKLSQNSLLLGTYSKKQDLYANKRIIGCDSTIFRVPFGFFDNYMEEKKLPYYFLLNKDYEPMYIFIANPNNTEMTKKYFEFISEKLSV